MSNSDLLRLAERCEKATFPCDTLADAEEIASIKAAICHLVLGREYDAYSPDYTNSLDAAVSLVPEGLEWRIERRLGKGMRSAYASLWSVGARDIDYHANGHGKTTALALCAAALRARARNAGAA